MNLASRKLLMGLASISVVALNNRLQLNLDAGDIDWICSLALTVIGSQGVVDALKTRGAAQ